MRAGERAGQRVAESKTGKGGETTQSWIAGQAETRNILLRVGPAEDTLERRRNNIALGQERATHLLLCVSRVSKTRAPPTAGLLPHRLPLRDF